MFLFIDFDFPVPVRRKTGHEFFSVSIQGLWCRLILPEAVTLHLLVTPQLAPLYDNMTASENSGHQGARKYIQVDQAPAVS